MFSYFTVVYGLKQNQQFHGSLDISELLDRRNCIVHQHNSENDEGCGFPGAHFHGLFEYYTSIGYYDDRIIKQIKTQCSYFVIEDSDPLDYFLLVKRYQMDCVFFKMCAPSELNKHSQIYDAIQHKSTRRIGNDTIPRPWCLKLLKTAHDSILSLCKAFHLNSSVSNYLTPSDSAAFVHSWCISQNISTGEFVNNWIYCLNSEPGFKNTLFFQGVNMSCPKAILDSIIDACKPFVGKVSNGTTGYKFFWRGCLGKRMIALYEPHFDRLHYTDKMLEILEGSESFVPVDINEYIGMQRTPVVILAQEYPSDRKLHFEIKNRLVKSYSKLKNFLPPERKLHPMWLCELADKYYVPWNESTNFATPNKEPTKANNITVHPGRSAETNIINNDAVQPRRSAETNIINNDAVQPRRSADTNIINNDAVQPGRSAKERASTECRDILLEDYLRRSNTQEDSDSTSDLSEDENEKAPPNFELNRPKPALNVPDMNLSSKTRHCENINKGNTGSNEVKKHGLDARESVCEGEYQVKFKEPFPNEGLFIKSKRVPCKNIITPPVADSFPTALEVATTLPPSALAVNLQSQVINSHGPSNKGKKTKGVPCKNRNASPVSDLPTAVNLQSQDSHSSGPSHTKRVSFKIGIKRKASPVSEVVPSAPLAVNLQSQGVNSPSNKKRTKEVPCKNGNESTGVLPTANQQSQEFHSPGPSNPKSGERKRKPDKNLSAKEKVKRLWEENKEKRPEQKLKCTYKNLMPKGF